ncbi:hypothetical protein FIM10_02050 [Sphingomonadales bacterium 56]|uniref:hypothetical protein n=1 Tax=Sphingobium sp. S6 TaxID=2758386 RepID=UPI00191B2725|nr:hypothetical protein [Sphingobium sp. S6]MBY2927464.1 hypothetical protein [Sphingomonadales bacterium 56]CAD7335276.1 hypothetical protein SPHS6_00417 [Sphingobium sp. S6]
MSWEPISNVKPAAPSAAKVPPMGVSVAARKLSSRLGKTVRYIKVAIGPQLAKALCMVGDQAGLRLSLGGGKFAGHVALSVDNAADCFRAKRGKDGGYVLTINEASAEGLFALEFPPFATAADLQPLEKGKPPLAAFKASEPMLAVED